MKRIGLLLVLLPIFSSAHSQTPITSETASTIAPAQLITLGNSAVSLNGPWKFEPGDSPWVNGEPLWAQPGYDDSKWAVVDLTPEAESIDPQFGTGGYVPGWTRRGYPELSGYAWYRLRVRVTHPDQKLWMKMPDNFDDAYQVYVDGRYLGQYGNFSRSRILLYYERPASFALPMPGPDGRIDLAVRFYMSPATRFGQPAAGGMHGPPTLGLAPAVRLLQGWEEDSLFRSMFGGYMEGFLYFLVAPLALWAWLHNRQERAWLWLFLIIAINVVNDVIGILGALTTLISIGMATFWQYVIFGTLFLPLWIMFWWQWFLLRDRPWIPSAIWILAAARALAGFCAQSPILGLNFLPQSTLHLFNTAALCLAAVMCMLLLVILAEGFRRDLTEALLAVFPILVLLFSVFSHPLLAAFNVPATFFPFGLGIEVGNVAYILMIVVICALAFRRFVLTQVRESLRSQEVQRDLEQARELQQHVLIPEPTRSPAFSLEVEYCPARTVGGDFFQTLTKPDGGLLVVIGDVSGKGVTAAMLVSVLVGAIRNQAESNFDPPSMLATLNRRMSGRSGGHFATCIVADMSTDGTMRVANAGHIPPYLNGTELNLEGSLPLGLTADAEWPVQTFTLKPGDRLTFMTDGVVEATNAAKELFGFERTREISRERAAAIVRQAQSFGQEDDITVLGIEYSGLLAVM